MDDAAQDRLSSLRDDHYRQPFPARLRVEDIGEGECVMADDNIAGCVQTLLSHGPRRPAAAPPAHRTR